MSETLRAELPELPPRMRALHVRRGYPVPWFVTWLDNGVPVPAGEGEPDFRVITAEAVVGAVRDKRCWVCGGRLGAHLSFVVGPMCVVNRTSAEPPSHLECAEFSARACPFLTRPHMRRNEGKPLPEGTGEEHVAGKMILRNPGVAVVWTTRRYRVIHDRNGKTLFDIGEPEHVTWYAEGRDATREEVKESINSGLHFLEEAAGLEGELALKALDSALRRAERLLPGPALVQTRGVTL